VRENDSGHRTVGADAPGDPDREEAAPAAGGDATGCRGAAARAAAESGGSGLVGADDTGADTGDAGDVLEAVAAFVDDLVEHPDGHHPGG
jgi:hypothetical protein